MEHELDIHFYVRSRQLNLDMIYRAAAGSYLLLNGTDDGPDCDAAAVWGAFAKFWDAVSVIKR